MRVDAVNIISDRPKKGSSRIWRLVAALESRTFFLISVGLFRLALDLSYVLFVSPKFAYAGFGVDFTIVKYVESWALLALFSSWAPSTLTKPSDYLVLTLFLTLMVPMLAYYGLANQDRYHLYVAFIGYSLISLTRNRPGFKLPFVKNGFALGLAIALIGAVIVSVWFVYSGGTRYFNLDLTQVYEYRRDVAAVTNTGPMAYLNVWATKVFGPLLLAIALLHRRWWLVVFAVLLHVFWFGVSAHKAVLFYPLLVFFVWFWFRSTRALGIYALGVLLVVAVSTAVYLAVGDMTLGTLFVRRTFFVPAKNVFYYYEFFSQNAFIWWSDSITSSFINYPYELPPAELVGDLQGTESHVNISFIAMGFAHAGAIGVFLYSVLVGFIFRVVDSFAARGLDSWFCIAVVLVPMWALLRGSDLPTAILTHGVGISLLLLFLVRKRQAISSAGPRSASVTHAR